MTHYDDLNFFEYFIRKDGIKSVDVENIKKNKKLLDAISTYSNSSVKLSYFVHSLVDEINEALYHYNNDKKIELIAMDQYSYSIFYQLARCVYFSNPLFSFPYNLHRVEGKFPSRVCMPFENASECMIINDSIIIRLDHNTKRADYMMRYATRPGYIAGEELEEFGRYWSLLHREEFDRILSIKDLLKEAKEHKDCGAEDWGWISYEIEQKVINIMGYDGLLAKCIRYMLIKDVWNGFVILD